MPEEEVIQRAHEDASEGKSPSTQAGEFVREEIDHVREGKHGARSVKQAIAIGLSKARRAGVSSGPQDADRNRAKSASKPPATSAKAATPAAKFRHAFPRHQASPERESTSTASRSALARQARSSARRRGPAARHRSAERAVHTKGKRGMHLAALKAARTRQRHRRAA